VLLLAVSTAGTTARFSCTSDRAAATVTDVLFRNAFTVYPLHCLYSGLYLQTHLYVQYIAIQQCHSSLTTSICFHT
jgi:hypothetical protein